MTNILLTPTNQIKWPYKSDIYEAFFISSTNIYFYLIGVYISMILKQHIKKLWIEQTYRTPEIEFTYGKLSIWGTFVPENPVEFYLPVHEWVKKYSNAPAPDTIIDIGLTYIRGYAMNYIKKLLQELIMLHNEEHQVIIN